LTTGEGNLGRTFVQNVREQNHKAGAPSVEGGAADQAEQFMEAKRTLLTALAEHRLTMANEGRAERVM
jgi:hypothetical protein